MTESLPLLTAVGHRWEADLAERLGRCPGVHLVRRCADVAELLGAVEAGLGSVVVVSSDLRGVDRDVVGRLLHAGTRVLGVHPPGQPEAADRLAAFGLRHVLPADAGQERLAHEIDLLCATPLPEAGPGADELAAPGRSGVGHIPAGGDTGARRREDGQVVAVWGPTGAPGRTTVAVTLAAELAVTGEPVLLLDADTYGAAVGQVLGVLDEAPGLAAACRAAGSGRLTPQTLVQLAPQVLPGLRVLTGLPRTDRWPELREHALAEVLRACRSAAGWVVVDAGFCLEVDEELSFDTRAPRRNGATLAVLEEADHVVAVGAADPVGVQRLVRGLEDLREASRAPRTVVLNRVRPGPVGRDPEQRLHRAMDRLAGVEDALLVPEDRAGCDAALLTGRTLREERPHSPARAAVVELARRVGAPARRHRRGASAI